MISIKLLGTPLSWDAKCSYPVAVRVSKRCELKLPIQMENSSCIKSLLQRGDYMTTLYLKDAYLSIPVHKDSQKFLQFLWRNTCFVFWLKYCSKGFYQTLQTRSRILTQKGRSYDPLSRRLPYPRFVSPGSTEEHLSGCYTLGRLSSQ